MGRSLNSVPAARRGLTVVVAIMFGLAAVAGWHLARPDVPNGQSDVRATDSTDGPSRGHPSAEHERARCAQLRGSRAAQAGALAKNIEDFEARSARTPDSAAAQVSISFQVPRPLAQEWPEMAGAREGAALRIQTAWVAVDEFVDGSTLYAEVAAYPDDESAADVVQRLQSHMVPSLEEMAATQPDPALDRTLERVRNGDIPVIALRLEGSRGAVARMLRDRRPELFGAVEGTGAPFLPPDRASLSAEEDACA